MFRLAAKWANITSLCGEGAMHHYGEAITSLRRSRYITLYKRSNLCYNKPESAERDVHFVRDVSFGSDVRFARE